MDNLQSFFTPDEIERLKNTANRTLIYGFPVKDMTKEDLLIAFAVINELHNKSERQKDEALRRQMTAVFSSF